MLRIGLSSKTLIWSAVIAAAFAVVTFVVLAAAYRDFEHENSLRVLQIETNTALQEQARALEIELQKFSVLPLTLAENSDVRQALLSSTPSSIASLNAKLSTLAERTLAPYVYVINPEGVTVAASNHAREDSFVGRDYAFRPYFQEALANGSASYFAKGELTGKSGLFLAQRIDVGDRNMGVVVVKVEFEELTSVWESGTSTTFVTNPDNIVLFSSEPALNYKAVQPLSQSRRASIRSSMQFGDEQLGPTPITIGSDLLGSDAQGEDIQAAALDLSETGWRIYRTERIAPALRAADSRIQLRLLSIGVAIVGVFLLLIWRIWLDRQRARTTKWLESEVARQTRALSETNTQLAEEIHKREQLSKRFRNAREDLALANRLGSIGAITTRVAHEVNQPVAAIQAFAENTTKLLARKDFDRADQNLSSIVELTSKIGRITTDLRDYARRGTETIGPVSIQDVVDGVELLVGDRLRNNSVSFEISLREKPLPDIKAGKVRVEQVLVNLIQNASEALEETEDGVIELSIFEDLTHVVFRVSDNGPGVDAGIQSEIFDPFFTSKPKGLGIGLGIAKDIVGEFGGTLSLVKPEIGGASFEMRLLKS